MRTFAAGTVFTHERRFTDDDVAEFVRISGDAGRHHQAPGPDGRRVVHGLLTATLPIRCEMTIVEATHDRGRWKLRFEGACKNQQGVEVLRVRSHGVVLDDDA